MISSTFQIGDEVLIIGPTITGCKLHAGEKFTISQEGNNDYTGKGYPWYPASSLRLAPQFTIGNLVEVVRASNYDSRHLVGEKFTIDDIEGDRYTAVGYPWIRADCLRLVEELKIGDWVEHEDIVFQIADISEGEPYYLHRSGKTFEKWYHPSALRKLTPEEALCHITKRHSEYIDASLEALKGRISAIEKQLKEQQEKINQFDGEISHLMGSIQECLMESGDVEARARCREMAIEKRLDFVEKSQRDSTMRAKSHWTAGP
jgi:hypothetical protein